MLYKHPGKHKIHGDKFDYIITDDAEAALKDGWSLTTPEALGEKPENTGAPTRDEVKAKADELGIALTNEKIGDVPLAPIDYESMHECLTNLVGNAIDACQVSNGCSWYVAVWKFEKNGVITYEVSDNGCGMDYEVKKKVFTTFFTTKGLGGSGLGLLMTKKIVQEHGGKIELESKPGEGTTFRIKFPRRRLPQIKP